MPRLDQSPIPAYAITLWCDDNNIYAALPMTAGGIPYICRYPRSEGGLAQALQALQARRKEVLEPSAAAPVNYTIPPQPQVKMTGARARLHAETTASQRENARKVLAKLGLK